MKLQKLTIKNLASIEDAVIDFENGPLKMCIRDRTQRTLRDNWHDIVTDRRYVAVVVGEMEKDAGNVSPGNSQTLLPRNRRRRDGPRTLPADGDCHATVSYTHLDVYKRQT